MVFGGLAASYVAVMIGCGGSSGGSRSNVKAGGPMCGPGQVSTQAYGCLSQGGCQAGYGMYNNQCYPGTLANTPGGGYQYGAGSCNGGQVYTYHGCLPTNGCSNGYGWYQSQCIPPLTIGQNGVPNQFNSYYGGGGYSGGGGYQGGYNTGYMPYGYYYYPNVNYRYYNNYTYPSTGAYFNLYLGF